MEVDKAKAAAASSSSPSSSAGAGPQELESDEELRKQLEEMGFSDAEQVGRAIKAVPPPRTLDGLLQWLVSNDGDAGESSAEQSGQDGGSGAKKAKVVNSYKCIETGKLFRTLQDAQLYAERTGRDQFEESDVEVPPLTEEEKREKLEQLRKKIEDRKKERAEQERKDKLEGELARRKAGREMAQIREQHEELQRRREIEAAKREKEAAKRHREELKEKIAYDKAGRAANAAKSRGASPDEVKKAFQDAYDRAMGKGQQGEKSKAEQLSIEQQMDQAIQDLLTYRAGGDGERALNTLKKMLGNVIEQPEEPKFKSINLDNPAFKKRVAGLKGGIALLKACGFKKLDVDRQLVLEDEILNMERISKAIAKIETSLKN